MHSDLVIGLRAPLVYLHLGKDRVGDGFAVTDKRIADVFGRRQICAHVSNNLRRQIVQDFGMGKIVDLVLINKVFDYMVLRSIFGLALILAGNYRALVCSQLLQHQLIPGGLIIPLAQPFNLKCLESIGDGLGR